MDEKSAQVQQMNKISEGANLVYCSVGCHAADSEWLCAAIQNSKEEVQEQGFAKLRLSFAQKSPRARLLDWLGTQTDAQRFVTAWNNFNVRPIGTAFEFSKSWYSTTARKYGAAPL